MVYVYICTVEGIIQKVSFLWSWTRKERTMLVSWLGFFAGASYFNAADSTLSADGASRIGVKGEAEQRLVYTYTCRCIGLQPCACIYERYIASANKLYKRVIPSSNIAKRYSISQQESLSLSLLLWKWRFVFFSFLYFHPLFLLSLRRRLSLVRLYFILPSLLHSFLWWEFIVDI